jgi:hypothetical protein
MHERDKEGVHRPLMNKDSVRVIIIAALTPGTSLKLISQFFSATAGYYDSSSYRKCANSLQSSSGAKVFEDNVARVFFVSRSGACMQVTEFPLLL